MRRISLHCVIALLLLGGAGIASAAQATLPGGALIPLPGGTPLTAPLPPPLPGPTNGAYVIPRVDTPVSRNNPLPSPPSFSDRIESCLSQGAADGLGPGENEAYSRTCA